MPPTAPIRFVLPRRARRAVATAALVAAAVGLAACTDLAPDGSSGRAPATAGLVVLEGGPNGATLQVRDGAGAPREVPLPARTTTWISAARDGSLVATLADGTIRTTSRPRVDQDPAWREIPRADVERPDAPLHFATWAPDGSRLVAVATDFGAAGGLILTIVDAAGESSLLVPVTRRPLPGPPVWLGEAVVLVQTTTGLTAVSTETTDVAIGPQSELGEGVALDAAEDGSVVALADPDGGAVAILDQARWRSGAADARLARVSADGEVRSVALDRRGERLAVAWQGPDGGSIAVYRRADDWREAEQVPVSGENVVVDWLP